MLLPDRLTLMQRIQDAARHGYYHFTSGQISPEKWLELRKKFAMLYSTNLKKSTRCNWRKRGDAVSFCYGYPSPPHESPRVVRWVLLSTEGVGLVHAREQLLHMQGTHLELDGYEIVHDGRSWSWRMTTKRFQYWRDRIHAVAALHPERRAIGEDAAGVFDANAEAIQDALYNAPGFRLVRQQVGKLVQFLRAEWKRLRPNTGVQPRLRTFLPYVQRLPNKR
jgi:hypothetical protein